MVNSEGRGYGVELWRWAAMVVLRMRDDEGEVLKDGNGWSEDRCWEKWRKSLAFEEENMAFKEEVRKFRIPVVLQDREHGFEILSQKRIRTRFAFLWNSHWDFGKGLRACIFENWHRSKFAQGMCCAKIAESWFFLPYFPLFSPWLHSSSFPTCMLTQKNQFKTH